MRLVDYDDVAVNEGGLVGESRQGSNDEPLQRDSESLTGRLLHEHVVWKRDQLSAKVSIAPFRKDAVRTSADRTALRVP